MTTDRLRTLLGATINGEANAYIDALAALLPADDTPLNARSVAVALLAVLCGEQPTQAPSAALQLAAYRLRGVTQRCDQVGGAMMLWHDIPEAGGTLAETLAGLIEDIGAGTASATLPIFQVRRVSSPSVDAVLIVSGGRIGP